MSVPAPNRTTSWRRSSRCASAACVEVAEQDTKMLVRDSKETNGDILEFDLAAWRTFIAGIPDAP